MAMWRLTTGNTLRRGATLTPEELGLPDWLDVFPSDGALEPQVVQPARHLQNWLVEMSVLELVRCAAGLCLSGGGLSVSGAQGRSVISTFGRVLDWFCQHVLVWWTTETTALTLLTHVPAHCWPGSSWRLAAAATSWTG